MSTLSEYQGRTADTAIYPGAGTGSIEAIVYLTLGLSEVGEIQQMTLFPEGSWQMEDLYAEMGDLLWYVVRLYAELGQPVHEFPFDNDGTLDGIAGLASVHVCEVQGFVKKALRDKGGRIGGEDTGELLALVDKVGASLSTLAWVSGSNLSYVAARNLAKLADRKERGVLGGSGDHRDRKSTRLNSSHWE